MASGAHNAFRRHMVKVENTDPRRYVGDRTNRRERRVDRTLAAMTDRAPLAIIMFHGNARMRTGFTFHIHMQFRFAHAPWTDTAVRFGITSQQFHEVGVGHLAAGISQALKRREYVFDFLFRNFKSERLAPATSPRACRSVCPAQSSWKACRRPRRP